MDKLYCILFIIAGIYTLWSALTDRPAFYNHRKAQTFVKLFGHTGTKIFYTVLGAFILVMGIILIF